MEALEAWLALIGLIGSVRLGHSNVGITQNIYTHLSANKKRETANIVGDALKKV